jgi:histidinol-phosphate aminotransferase
MHCDLCPLAASGVRGLQPYEPGKPIEELERELGIRVLAKLASNENPLGPGPRAVQAIREHLQGLSYYPDGSVFALRGALALKHGVPPACITVGNGSNDVLDLVARAFLGPGRAAVFSRHAFIVYPIATQAVGATARVSPANGEDHDMPYGHDLEAMFSLINSQTRVVFIANPNNPTGTWIPHALLHDFLETVPREVLVVVDEAYFEYVREPEYPDTSTWLDRFPHLVVTRTFSKIHALAGLRIGYGLSSPAIAELLNRVRQPFNVNSLAQVGALSALDDGDHVRRSIELNTAGMSELTLAFRERSLSYIPSVGNFVCVDMARPAIPVYQALLKEGIIVRPVANYGFPNYLRISIGTPEQNRLLLKSLDKVLAL